MIARGVALDSAAVVDVRNNVPVLNKWSVNQADLSLNAPSSKAICFELSVISQKATAEEAV